MRALLVASLTLLACPKPSTPAAATTAPVVAVVEAGAPAGECTLETRLVPGVPGSPGHLIPSELNPNGASELATLMRTFVADWRDARAKLEADAGTALAARWPVHRKMRCAWPTAEADRSPAFDGLAVNYLLQVRRFDERPSRETYEAVLDGCKSCHEVSCGGPLELIEGMRWK